MQQNSLFLSYIQIMRNLYRALKEYFYKLWRSVRHTDLP